MCLKISKILKQNYPKVWKSLGSPRGIWRDWHVFLNKKNTKAIPQELRKHFITIDRSFGIFKASIIVFLIAMCAQIFIPLV